MAIYNQFDKRSGITYVYESKYIWVPELKQSRKTSKLLGRLDEKTGKVVATDGRCRKKSATASTHAVGAVSCDAGLDKGNGKTVRKFYGATYLLDAIGEKLGITADIKRCFPDNWQKILSIAYYLVLEDSTVLYRFERWGMLHKHPFGNNITSQRSSELFASITEGQKNEFFCLQGKRRIEKEYWAYDTTTFSSYSETLAQVQYGKNKEDDKLPQINLALLFGEESGLPFYYRKLAGNIPDVKTVMHLLEELDVFGFSKIKLVMDRGFYSVANINGLFRSKLKFLVATKTSTVFVRKAIESVYDNMRSHSNYIPNFELFGITVPLDWQYSQGNQNKIIKKMRTSRIYLQVFYNIDKAADDEKNIHAKLGELKEEIERGKRNTDNEKKYKKFFDVKVTAKGIKAIPKDDAINEELKLSGFFVLVTNELMNPETALMIYRAKDVVEKAFGNIKERLNMRRLLVSSEESLEGKLFLAFVALIYLSYINKQMHDEELYKNYTLNLLLDKLDVIECFERPGKNLEVGEILEKQVEIYKKLGIEPPTSS
ncbi:MAG: IS1634 family transposase [Deltaproteobacteria bacterium]|jgi:transposase|nr:IS1634 family transposase [Deltaproteobacteria bacterium]